MKFKFILLACLFFAFSAVFAQDETEKFVVYVTGASEAGINKSLSGKLAAAIAQSGKYAEIIGSEDFYRELSKNDEVGMNQVIQTAKLHGTDILCVVAMTEVLGTYSFSARIIKTADSQIEKTVSLDNPLKTIEDITDVSNALAIQLFQLEPSPPPSAAIPAAAVPQQCDKKYNINELLAQIQYGFPSQLSDCGSSLVKAIAMSKVPFSKTAAPEPKSYMTECTMDGIKGRLPDGFPGLDKVIDDTQKFLQTVLNTALAGGTPNPASLMKAASDINGLLDGIKNLKNGACIIDEPYEYVEPVKETPESSGGDEGGKKEDGFFTFGIRTGMNFSHYYAEYSDSRGHSTDGTYDDIVGFQLGFVFDFAVSEVFHIQPGIMYIQKGARDNRNNGYSYDYYYNMIRTHNIEIPVLLSLKLSAFRINAGPYFDICIASYGSGSHVFDDNNGFGISTGLGFDIGWFYIGMFYDYGLTKSYYEAGYTYNIYGMRGYNRTLGFNIGVNL